MKRPVAFMSYAHRDDWSGRLTELREHLSHEVSVQIGEDFEIFQDRDGISWGENWKERIEDSLDEVTFLIVIISPSFFTSSHCRNELERFLDREKKLGRNDLVLPIYYVDTPLVNSSPKRANDELAQVIASRQYVDWRDLDLRTESLTSPQVAKNVIRLGSQIRHAWDRMLGAEVQRSRLNELYGRARRWHRDQQWQAVVDAFAEIHAESQNYPDPEGLLESAYEALKMQDQSPVVEANEQPSQAEEVF